MEDAKNIQLPMLLGPSNLDHWSDIFLSTIRRHTLDEHMTPSDRPCEDCDRDWTSNYKKLRRDIKKQQEKASNGDQRAVQALYKLRNEKRTAKIEAHMNCSDDWVEDECNLILAMKMSLAKIRPQLIAAGWDPDPHDDRDTTALKHYEFIMREVPSMTSVVETNAAVTHQEADDIVDELCSIDVNDYGSLTDYQEKIKSLRRRLTRADIYFPDKMLINIAISGLSKADTYQAWAKELSDEVDANRLNWVLLMAAMSIKAMKELQDRMEE